MVRQLERHREVHGLDYGTARAFDGLRAALALSPPGAVAPVQPSPLLATFRTYDHADGHTTATCDAIPSATGSGRNAHEAIGALLCYARHGLAAQIAIHGDGDEDAMPDWRAPSAPALDARGLDEQREYVRHMTDCDDCAWEHRRTSPSPLCIEGQRLAAAVGAIEKGE